MADIVTSPSEQIIGTPAVMAPPSEKIIEPPTVITPPSEEIIKPKVPTPAPSEEIIKPKVPVTPPSEVIIKPPIPHVEEPLRELAPGPPPLVVGVSPAKDLVIVKDPYTGETYFKPGTSEQITQVAGLLAVPGAVLPDILYEPPPGVTVVKPVTGSLAGEPKRRGPITLYDYRGVPIELSRKQLAKLYELKGEEQFKQMIKLGILQEGSEFVQLEGKEWAYYTPFQIKTEEKREQALKEALEGLTPQEIEEIRGGKYKVWNYEVQGFVSTTKEAYEAKSEYYKELRVRGIKIGPPGTPGAVTPAEYERRVEAGLAELKKYEGPPTARTEYPHGGAPFEYYETAPPSHDLVQFLTDYPEKEQMLLDVGYKKTDVNKIKILATLDDFKLPDGSYDVFAAIDADFPEDKLKGVFGDEEVEKFKTIMREGVGIESADITEMIIPERYWYKGELISAEERDSIVAAWKAEWNRLVSEGKMYTPEWNALGVNPEERIDRWQPALALAVDPDWQRLKGRPKDDPERKAFLELWKQKVIDTAAIALTVASMGSYGAVGVLGARVTLATSRAVSGAAKWLMKPVTMIPKVGPVVTAAVSTPLGFAAGVVPTLATVLTKTILVGAPMYLAGRVASEQAMTVDFDKKWNAFKLLPPETKDAWAQKAGYEKFEGLDEAQQADVLIHYKPPAGLGITEWTDFVGEKLEQVHELAGQGIEFLAEHAPGVAPTAALMLYYTYGVGLRIVYPHVIFPLIAANTLDKIPRGTAAPFLMGVGLGLLTFMKSVPSIAMSGPAGFGEMSGLFGGAGLAKGVFRKGKSAYRVGEAALREHGIFPKALKGTGDLDVTWIKVPEPFERIAGELAGKEAIYEDIIRRNPDPAVQKAKVRELLSPEVQTAFDAIISIVDGAKEFKPTKEMIRVVDFSNLPSIPKSSAAAIKVWFQKNPDVVIGGSFADHIQTKGFKWTASDFYGLKRIGDLDITLPRGGVLNPSAAAKQLGDTVKATSDARVTVRGARVIINGKEVITFHVAEEFATREPWPYGWSEMKPFVTEGIKFVSLGEQIIRRGRQVIKPGIEEMRGLIGREIFDPVEARRIKDPYRFMDEVHGIAGELERLGKTSEAKQLRDNLDVSWGGDLQAFLEKGFEQPPLTTTQLVDTQKEFIKLVDEAQKKALDNGFEVSVARPAGSFKYGQTLVDFVAKEYGLESAPVNRLALRETLRQTKGMYEVTPGIINLPFWQRLRGGEGSIEVVLHELSHHKAVLHGTPLVEAGVHKLPKTHPLREMLDLATEVDGALGRLAPETIKTRGFHFDSIQEAFHELVAIEYTRKASGFEFSKAKQSYLSYLSYLGDAVGRRNLSAEVLGIVSKYVDAMKPQKGAETSEAWRLFKLENKGIVEAQHELGTLYRYQSPAGRTVKGTVYTAVRNLKDYVRTLDYTKKQIGESYIEAGRYIDEFGKWQKAERPQIFTSPDAAFNRLYDLYEGKIPKEAGIVAIRVVKSDLKDVVTGPFRTEPVTEVGMKTYETVLDERLLQKGKRAYATEPTGLSYRKGSASGGLVGETLTYYPAGARPLVPTLWLATKAAKDAGLEAPSKAQVHAMNQMAIKAVISDIMHLRFRTPKHFEATTTPIEGAHLVELYRDTYVWKGKPKAEVTRIINERAGELNKEAAENLRKRDVVESRAEPTLTLDAISKYETRMVLDLIRKDEAVSLAKLTKEIKAEGMKEPITIRVREDGTRIVWDGLHRLIAAQDLGLKNVPVKYIGAIHKVPELFARKVKELSSEEYARALKEELEYISSRKIQDAVTESRGIQRVLQKTQTKEVSDTYYYNITELYSKFMAAGYGGAAAGLKDLTTKDVPTLSTRVINRTTLPLSLLLPPSKEVKVTPALVTEVTKEVAPTITPFRKITLATPVIKITIPPTEVVTLTKPVPTTAPPTTPTTTIPTTTPTTPPKIPTYPPPPPPPPTLPPLPTKPPRVPPGAPKKEAKQVRIPPGSIAWKQGELKGGVVWKYIPPPWNQPKPITLVGKVPAGAKNVDMRTPRETIQQIGEGPVPADISIDLGIADIYITEGGKRIRYEGKGLKTDVGKRIESPTMGMSIPPTVNPKPLGLAGLKLGTSFGEYITRKPKNEAQEAFLNREIANMMSEMNPEQIVSEIRLAGLTEPKYEVPGKGEGKGLGVDVNKLKVIRLLEHLPDRVRAEVRRLLREGELEYVGVGRGRYAELRPPWRRVKPVKTKIHKKSEKERKEKKEKKTTPSLVSMRLL